MSVKRNPLNYEQALQEMTTRAAKYSEMERVARNNRDNCSMDHASGAKHAYFQSARLIRAALAADRGIK